MSDTRILIWNDADSRPSIVYKPADYMDALIRRRDGGERIHAELQRKCGDEWRYAGSRF